MKNRQQEFLSFAYRQGALKFGEYVLNSGRVSPYFLNTGNFASGPELSTLAGFYASSIEQHVSGKYMLYGPAYKGIPLAAATAVALYMDHGKTVNYAFNRKEAKDHGDKGWIVGAPLHGRVVLVEDVITSGLSIDVAVDIIQAQGAQPTAVAISLDRMERASESGMPAVEYVRQKHGIDVFAVATVYDLLEFVTSANELKCYIDSVQAYFDEYVSKQGSN